MNRKNKFFMVANKRGVLVQVNVSFQQNKHAYYSISENINMKYKYMICLYKVTNTSGVGQISSQKVRWHKSQSKKLIVYF